MTEIIKFDRIVSVSNEVQGHGAQNILDGEISPSKNWMCEAGTEKAALILQLERAAILSSIHVGNAHSAFVEVLVGRAAEGTDRFEGAAGETDITLIFSKIPICPMSSCKWELGDFLPRGSPPNEDFASTSCETDMNKTKGPKSAMEKSFVPMSSFMNPHESKTGTNPNRTRFFTKEDFNEAAATKCWDRVKVVCSQPFNKCVRYGLCFLKVHGEAEAKKVGALGKEEDKGEIKVGSFFKKMRTSKADKPLTVSEQIKEAEKESSLVKHSPISIAKIAEKMTSDKKAKPSTSESKEEKRKDKTPKGKTKETVKRKKEKPLGDEKTSKRRRKKSSGKPFGKLMEDVVLVISGFKNPLRGDIRSKALQMGAKYSSDWEPHCTHLVCAYENTPKCQQVRGKGKIVKKEWVEHCHRDRKRYPWRRFALDKADSKKPESEEEIEEEEEEEEEEKEEETKEEEGKEVGSVSMETSSKEEEGECSTKTKSDVCDDYEVATDEDEEEQKEVVDTTNYPMPFLPDMFSLKTFFLDSSLPGRAVLERYIIAYNGVLTGTFNEDVNFYITDKGGPLLEVFRKKAPNVVAVRPSWIWEINAKQKFVPPTSHLVK